MSDDLLVGILVKEGMKPLAMVVDKRVSKERDAIGPREVEVRFGSAVSGISIIEDKSEQHVKGNLVKLALPGSGGQLLELE